MDEPYTRDYFTRKLIALYREELFPSQQAKFDEWAKRHTVEEQAAFLVGDAMKGWKPPAWYTRPVEEVEPVKLVDRDERQRLSGKDLASGEKE